ncbi:MAG: hypothetical protein RLZZ65_1649 [Bacteroidota bacterium]|jgi:type III pantothenate kinase
MPLKNEVYLVDAGNTQVKIAFAQNGIIQWVRRLNHVSFSLSDLDSNIPVAYSSVIGVELKNDLQHYFKATFEIQSGMSLPFEMCYESPETLGMDRLCNAAALSQIQPGRPRLAVDLGTCIKFDFLDAEQKYLGGSISPGLQMRAKALAHFTSKLPELKISVSPQFIGTNSQSSIEIGTYLGWQKEIEGFISAYQKKYPDIYIALTGGDAAHFDMGQKSGIFVHENLTLEGILSLYLTHA